MINIFRKATTNGNRVVVNYTEAVEEYSDKKINREAINKISDKLTSDWIDMYGDRLLQELTPEEVKTRIHKNLAKKVLES